MAEEPIPETRRGATRALLGAIGFLGLMFGGELVFQAKPPEYWLGGVLGMMGAASFYSAVAWNWTKRHAPYVRQYGLWWVAIGLTAIWGVTFPFVTPAHQWGPFPTSSEGLAPGSIYQNGSFLAVVPGAPPLPDKRDAIIRDLQTQITAAQQATNAKYDARVQELTNQVASLQTQLTDATAKVRISPEYVYALTNELASNNGGKLETNTFVVVSSAPDNEELRHDLETIFSDAYAQSNQKSVFRPMALPDYTRDLDAPRLSGQGVSGITIHSRSKSADFIAQTLGLCFTIHRSSDAPEALLDFYSHSSTISPGWLTEVHEIIWVEIGRGSPWGQRNCR